MSNAHIQIGDAIAAAIEDAALGVTVSRVWRPTTVRDDLTGGVVQVVPAMFASAPSDRAKMREEYGVDVGLQQECDPDVIAEVDALHDKLHTIRGLFEPANHRLSLSGGGVAIWQSTETVSGAEAGYAPEPLEAQRIFTGVLRFTFLVIQ